MEPIIEAQHLRRTYGNTVAVDDVSFQVKSGEIFCIVGPNGAGKTTTVEMIMGLRRPERGAIRVLDLDPQRDDAALRRRIGVQLQEAALPNRLKVREALDLFTSFYDQTLSWEELLVDWGLAEKRDTAFDDLSGGQKQRLFIILALLNDPEIVFLDELTTGLDPAARRATWEAVEAIRERGKTVVLVTHFMDEAEALADRVAIIDNGRVVALDTPQALIDELDAAKRIRFTSPNGFDPNLLQSVEGVTDVRTSGRKVTIRGAGPLLARVATTLADHGLSPDDLSSEQADLEDVFMARTGHKSTGDG